MLGLSLVLGKQVGHLYAFFGVGDNDEIQTEIRGYFSSLRTCKGQWRHYFSTVYHYTNNLSQQIQYMVVVEVYMRALKFKKLDETWIKRIGSDILFKPLVSFTHCC